MLAESKRFPQLWQSSVSVSETVHTLESEVMEVEHGPLHDHFPLQISTQLVFQGVYLITSPHLPLAKGSGKATLAFVPDFSH